MGMGTVGRTKGVRERCEAHQQWAREEVKERRQDHVVESQRNGGMEPAKWQAGTARHKAGLAALKARVVVLEPPPDTGNLQKCRTRLSKPAQCEEPLTALHRDFSARSEERRGGKECSTRWSPER